MFFGLPNNKQPTQFILDFHRVSVYPPKEIPFFILFTAALCSTSAALALLTYRFPEQMRYAANMVSYQDSIVKLSVKGGIFGMIIP